MYLPTRVQALKGIQKKRKWTRKYSRKMEIISLKSKITGQEEK
jgi:hypothetical protein